MNKKEATEKQWNLTFSFHLSFNNLLFGDRNLINSVLALFNAKIGSQYAHDICICLEQQVTACIAVNWIVIISKHYTCCQSHLLTWYWPPDFWFSILFANTISPLHVPQTIGGLSVSFPVTKSFSFWPKSSLFKILAIVVLSPLKKNRSNRSFKNNLIYRNQMVQHFFNFKQYHVFRTHCF